MPEEAIQYPMVPYRAPIARRRVTEQERAEKKRSRREHFARLKHMMLLRGTGTSRAEIVNEFQTRYGLSIRQIDRYIEQAKEAMLGAIDVPIKELVAEAAEWYRSVLRGEKAKTYEKIMARKALDEVLGIKAPFKVAQTTTDGQDVARRALESLTDEELEILERKFEQAKAVHAAP